jgi:hypothetical protein
MVEATFLGYASVQLSAANWSAITVTVNVAKSNYTTTIAFTRTVTGTVQQLYGWYITDSGLTVCYAAARFATAPLAVTNAGDAIVLSNLQATAQSLN